MYSIQQKTEVENILVNIHDFRIAVADLQCKVQTVVLQQ
jgi:hypothetical protein